MEIIEVVEQAAIFDGKPNLYPLSAAISLINHNAYGGTLKDLQEAKEDGLLNPKRYNVRLVLSIEEL